jgi:hypothetical protein
MKMATIAALRLYPDWMLSQNRGFMAAATVGCMLLLLLALQQWMPVAAATVMLSLGSIVLLSMPMFALLRQATALRHAVSVMRTQRTPITLWRLWLRRWLLSVTLEGALICLLVSAGIEQMFNTAPYWRAIPVLLSLAQCLCACHVLAGVGMLPRVAGKASLLVYPLAIGLGLQFVPVLAWLSALPAVVLAAAAMAWPVMAWWLFQRNRRVLPVPVERTGALARLRHSRVAAWMARHTFLRDEDNLALMRAPGWAYLLFACATQIVCVLMLMSFQWGSVARPLQAIWLPLTCQLCTFVVMVRGVHWRTLLAPGGVQPGRIGTHILLSTLPLQLLVLALPAAALLVLTVLIGNGTRQPFGFMPNAVLATSALVALQLLFCTAVAIALRALPARQLKYARVSLPLFVLCISMLILFRPAMLPLGWHIGPGYAALLAAGTGVAMAVANRLWTPARLVAALKTS